MILCPDIEADYTAAISVFTVTFTVAECGYGMELLNGFYVAPHSAPLYVEQVRQNFHTNIYF